VARIYLTAALTAALHEEMARDPEVFIVGEDIQPGFFGRTDGLVEAFGAERVRDTPICEDTFLGLGVGAAAVGMRPIVDLQNANFIFRAMDQLMNNANKFRYMMGGDVDMPLTILATFGAPAAGQHSDAPYAQVINGGGIKVVVPTTPKDAKGLLKAAIRDPNPVLVLIHAYLGGVRDEVPDEDYVVTLGEAAVRREGTDVTVVAIGLMVRQALAAAEAMAKDGISVEVIDPRTLFPLDVDTIANSVEKTGRLIVMDEARQSCSVASEIVSRLATGGAVFQVPPRILANPDVHIPYNMALHDAVVPQAADLERAVRDVVGTVTAR
jgi:acetoin:2,6-dichlorophenolindophenol oxidoreductase subunit beta